MFFKQSVLKRLFKNAYKGVGLTVGQDSNGKGYYVAGSYWVIWVAVEHITKETKAAIIELCGDLPEPGEVFKAQKDGGNKYEIEQNEIYNLPERYEKAEIRFNVKKTIIESDGVLNRLLQSDDDNRHIIAINEVFMNLIDPGEVNYDKGEYDPDGPVAEYADGNFIYWGNKTCYLMATKRIMNNEEMVDYLEHLEKVDII